MKKLIYLAACWSSLCWGIDNQALNKSQSLEYPTIVRVYYQSKDQIQKIDAISDVWAINTEQQFATIQVSSKSDFQQIHALASEVRIDTKRLHQHALDQNKLSQANPRGSGIAGFSCYSTVAETFQRMDQMTLDYPELSSIIDIGDSWEKLNKLSSGSDLKVLKLTNENTSGDKPILFLSSSIHPREYATAELNTRFAEYLLNHYGTDADITWILDHHEIHLSLLTNPDGRKQAETGILWRKNTNQSYCAPGSQDRGVDLNRNYPFEWGIGGSTSECSEVFRGHTANTEPEVMAQMDYIRKIYDDHRGPADNDAAPDDTAGIFVDIHSYSELVLWPWGYTNSSAPNDNQLQALGKRAAYFNQYQPIPVHDLVLTGGGSIDAAYGELGVASLAFELGTAFFQDCDTFENEIYPDNLAALLYLARVTQAPYKQPSGPDIESIYLVPNVITGDGVVQVSGVANDDRYNQSNGAQSTGQVQSVTAYINELPIDANNGQALNASDGAYNQTSEAFSGDISTTGMSLGKSTVFVQAHDGNQAGATYAKFIDVVEPADVAQITGHVTDAITGENIENALLDINQSQALSANDGSFSQWVQPGISNLMVTADQYAPLSVMNLNLTAGSSQVQNIELQPFCDIFSDDMENGDIGWSAQSPWAISNELSNSPAHAWSDSPGGTYNDNLNVSLTSPDIDISNSETLEISYQHLCDTEATYDFGYFEVQYDGGGWQTIASCDNQSSWALASHQLTLQPTTKILNFRFRLETDGFVSRDGWYIDDVVVKASGGICGIVNDDIIFADSFE